MAGRHSLAQTKDMSERDPFLEGLRIIFEARPDLTPATVSVAAGLDNSTIRKLLSGSNSSPKVETAKRIANAMGYSLTDVVRIGEHPNAQPAVELHEEMRDLPEDIVQEALKYAQYLKKQREEAAQREADLLAQSAPAQEDDTQHSAVAGSSSTRRQSAR